MKEFWENGSVIRILLFGVLIALLGISPLSKAVTAGYDGTRRAKESSQLEMVAFHQSTLAEQQPWRSGFWEAAGVAALAAGDAQNAGNYFSRAASKAELSQNGYIAWGDADWQTGSSLTAIQIWEIAERLGAPPNEVLARQAEAYRVLNEDLALIETLESILHLPSILNHSPSDLGALNHELGLLLAAYKPASAPTYLSRAIEFDPSLAPQIRSLNFDIQRALSNDDPVYLLMISGRTLANFGYWDYAEKAFENAVEMQPEYAEAWAYLGEARQHTELDVEPLMALETALKLDPDSIAANTFLALYWRRNSENDLALKYLRNASTLEPDNPAYLVEIGNLVALIGDLTAGKEYYRQAIELSSNDPKYVREFLNFSIQFNLNLRDAALPVARQLVMLNPKDPTSLDLMGEVLLRLGDMLNAERFFLRALIQNPEYDQAHLHLGEFYQSQGNNDLARYHLKRVLEISTNTQTKARALQALETYFSP